ncbi:Transcriptional regulatory protein AfsQ1 [Lignipirellula cremea]|uniref:Transcriptional regulatory protein AfsQ1 n=2 Tax=Lignipirellula cremea TaxID=2528010 RepID=A0A518DVL2_9BACT|nr:Transcriptional regulatory protein AfsQ1 [Lignipirellula cremea]
MDALEDQGYELAQARDGRSAIALAVEHRPDLLLLDIMMPGIDGLLVLRQLKTSPATQDMKIIMLTALNTDTQVSECLNAGAMDYIIKPFSNMVLRAKVKAALRRADGAGSPSEFQGDSSTSRGRIVTFVGAKGGVGATTTALNVALNLAKDSQNVNFCELRSDVGTTGWQTGVGMRKNLSNLLSQDAAKIQKNDIRSQLTNHSSGLKMLLSGMVEQGAGMTPEHGSVIVNSLACLADLTVLDVPASSRALEVVLSMSDYVVVVTELEPLSLEATRLLLARTYNMGLGPKSVGVTVNSRASVAIPLKLPKVRELLDCEIIGVIPPDPDDCLAAANKSNPVVLYRPDGTLASAYQSLAQCLVAADVPAMTF